MSLWNSEQYLKFESQRTQPAIDLVKRITIEQPKNILDIGCGPGNSTSVLKTVFPQERNVPVCSALISVHITLVDTAAFIVMPIMTGLQLFPI